MTDVLFDERIEPSAAALDQLVGERSDLWHQLVRRIEEFGGRGQWAWGGPKYGWELKIKRGSRPFATLTPKQGGFVALVILGRAEVAAVDPTALGERMRGTFEAARQLPDGRWLFHPIQSERDVADTAALLALKLPPTIRARLASARPD
jgi:hypothetical protein